MGAQSDGSGTPSLRYLTALAEQLAADGCEPRQEQSSAGRVPVARRADFRIQRAVTRLHLLPSPRAVPGGFGVHDRRLHAVRPAVRDDHTAACRPACRLASRYSRAWSLREWIRRFGMGRGKAARPIRRHGAAGCRRRRGCRGRFQAHAVSGGHLRTTPATQADALFWECPAGARWQVVSAGIGLSRDRCPAHRRLPRGGKRPDRSCPRAARRPRGARVGAAADLASRANTLVGHPWHPSCPLGAGEGPAYQGAEVSRQARCVGHVLSRRGDVPEPHG